MLRRLLLINLLPLIFLVANVWVWWVATPLGFQRFGSVGVMLAILMFGLDRAERMGFRQNASAQRALLQTELWLVSVATVQWGYGDLFHCWSHGNGWGMC